MIDEKKITQDNAEKVRGKIQIIILAAGQGKRMGRSDLPKVLVPLKGKPLIEYLLAAVKNSGLCQKSIIVVGKMAEKVKKTLGDDYVYILQEEQLGTGHAVMMTRKQLEGKVDNILVLNGDHPLISPELIKNLVDTHLTSGGVLTMATVTTPDFDSWRSELASFAKILRDDQGKVIQILEKESLVGDQVNIKELNPAYMCFKANWLWKNLENLRTDNGLGEYQLTDLVKMAVDQGHKIDTVSASPKEALGINSSEQLTTIEKLL